MVCMVAMMAVEGMAVGREVGRKRWRGVGKGFMCGSKRAV